MKGGLPTEAMGYPEHAGVGGQHLAQKLSYATFARPGGQVLQQQRADAAATM